MNWVIDFLNNNSIASPETISFLAVIGGIAVLHAGLYLTGRFMSRIRRRRAEAGSNYVSVKGKDGQILNDALEKAVEAIVTRDNAKRLNEIANSLPMRSDHCICPRCGLPTREPDNE